MQKFATIFLSFHESVKQAMLLCIDCSAADGRDLLTGFVGEHCCSM